MTTARKKAREAVRPGLAGLQLETSNHAADAASDVWEPIVIKCINLLTELIKNADSDLSITIVNEDGLRDSTLVDIVLEITEEALGDD